jgi:hypothetical protein
MNEKLFAGAVAAAVERLAVPSSTAHIYSDGYILAFPVQEVNQQRMLDTLLKCCPRAETARSSRFVVFVLPMDDTDHKALRALVMFTTEGYHDHRQEDVHRIEDAASLLEEVVALFDGEGGGHAHRDIGQ